MNVKLMDDDVVDPPIGCNESWVAVRIEMKIE